MNMIYIQMDYSKLNNYANKRSNNNRVQVTHRDIREVTQHTNTNNSTLKPENIMKVGRK